MSRLGRRMFVLLAVAAASGGCAVAPKPYEKPKDIPLQDPPPGLAVLYLLRAPYDAANVAVSVGQRRLAVLPSSSYTVVVLPPGRHRLLTHALTLVGTPARISDDLELDLGPDQRRFFSLSGVMRKGPALAGVLNGVPLLVAEHGTAEGSRSWKEVTELDAQGLMSISKLKLPESGAL